MGLRARNGFTVGPDSRQVVLPLGPYNSVDPMLLVVSLMEEDAMQTSPAVTNGNNTLQNFKIWKQCHVICSREIPNSLKKSPGMLLNPARDEKPHTGTSSVVKIVHNDLGSVRITKSQR